MKIETQIAKDNVKKLRKLSDKVDWQFCKEHLTSCQRFLEFLNRWNWNFIENKITDLQNAIKIYEEANVE